MTHTPHLFPSSTVLCSVRMSTYLVCKMVRRRSIRRYGRDDSVTATKKYIIKENAKKYTTQIHTKEVHTKEVHTKEVINKEGERKEVHNPDTQQISTQQRST